MATEHSFTVTERKMIYVNGVSEILSFDETGALLKVGDTELNVTGSDLTVTKLSLETGEIELTGNIEAAFYTVPKQSKSVWHRLFG